MSRKSREDKSSWKIPSIYAFSGGYGPYRVKTFDAIDGAAVLIHNSSVSSSSKQGVEKSNSDEEKKEDSDNFYYSHPMHSLAGQLQQHLLAESKDYSSESKSFFILDVCDMFDDMNEYEDAISQENESQELTKALGKSILRTLRRMLVQNITLVAKDNLCGLLLKMYRVIEMLDPSMVSGVKLIHPKLSSNFINSNLVAYSVSSLRSSGSVDLVMVKSTDPRIDMIRTYFPNGSTQIYPVDQYWLLASFQENFSKDIDISYNPDFCNLMGRSLFLSRLTVEMNRRTKQYERNCEDITSNLIDKVHVYDESPQDSDFTNFDWSNCQREIGALVLRGNRCVLVRSLEGKWQGMRIPSVIPKEDENPYDTAVRAVIELTGVEATEVKVLSDIISPVYIYAPNGRPIVMQLYPLYATEPPVDGPLEDADMEDEESPYDWYLYSNAMKALDGQSIAALQTMSLSLLQAANVGLVPCKWGGVFGQELQIVCNSIVQETNTQAELTEQTSLLKTKVEEWKPAPQESDMLQYVREAKQIVAKRFDEKLQKQRKLPVTLLSGFLGSGKTTLLSHILTNYDGIKIAILVNDMGEINIDAALVKSTVSIRQREEHMVELSNGCICCTLREDLLVEVAKIASSEECYDYLIIESTGVSEPLPVAETFTFEDDSGLRLGDLAEIDTLVTVVDGSRFLSELDSLEKLQERNWHADPEDERTISHLLCDQVEFANVIVVNKCDLMDVDEKKKVKNLIKNMNPSAKLFESVFSAVPLEMVLGTRLFSMTEAEKHENWLKEARIGEHKPETEEYGIGSFTYRAIRPFSPMKFQHALEAMLNKSSPPFDTSTILRAKGFVWLANCPQIQGEFSLAGNHFSLLPGNPWWAEIEKCHWPENLEQAIAPLWHEPHGDRQQEIVIIGQLLDKEEITRVLNTCLISEDDFTQGQAVWDNLCEEEGDPFAQEWQEAIDTIVKGENHSHDHSHEHSHHH